MSPFRLSLNIMVLMMLSVLTTVRAGKCYQLTTTDAVEQCEEVSCESVFCGSRNEWLWACSGAYKKWWCNPYEKRDSVAASVEDLFSALEDFGWSSQLVAANSTVPEGVELIDDLEAFVASVTRSSVNNEQRDYEQQGDEEQDDEQFLSLDKRSGPRKKRCMKICTAADDLMRHCQKNGINISYNIVRAACVMACDKGYGNGHTNCKK